MKKPLPHFLAFCFLSLLIVVPNLIGLYSNIFIEGTFSLIDIVVLLPSYCLMMALFSLSFMVFRTTKLPFFLILFLTALSNMFDLGCARVLGSFIDLDHIKAIFGTNKTEVIEFTSLFRKYIPLILVPLAAALLVFAFVRRIPMKELPSRRHLWLAAAAFVTLGIVSMEIATHQRLSNSNRSAWRMRKLMTFSNPPFNVWSKIGEYVNYKHFRREMIEKRKQYVTDARIYDENTPEVIVFVIGERLRYANWTFNGYPRMTSPGLSKVSGLTSLHQNYSNGNSTEASIPYLMTGVDPLYDQNPFYKKSVLGLFTEAGYSTEWITNARIDYLEVSNEAEQFTSVINRDVDDTAILAPFRNALNVKKRKFILVNFRGPHVLKMKKHFTTNHEASAKEATTNKYDDMILNTDRILSEMIRMMDSTGLKCFMTVTSDHGTNLFDDHSANLYGYGSVVPTNNEIHTPLLIWRSKSFEQQYPEKVSTLLRNQTKRTSNSCVVETLLDAGNVTYRQSDRRRSLLSPQFRSFDTVGVMAQGRLFKIKLSNDQFLLSRVD